MRDQAPVSAGQQPSNTLLVTILSAAGLAVGFWVRTQSGAAGSSLALGVGFAASFLIARLLTVRLPQGDEVCVTLMVGLVGLSLVSVPLLIAGSLFAGVADALARLPHSSREQSVHRLLDAVRASAVLALASPWQLVLRPMTARVGSGDSVIAWSLVAALSYAALDILTTAIQQSIGARVPIGQVIASLLRPMGTIYVVHIPMAAVVLRLQSASQPWPFPVALLLTLILQNSFNLYLRIRRAYAETISALAHAAELDRPHDSGHARRVADLSVDVARRMGMSGRDLEKVGYAALLHDIGLIGAAGGELSGAHAKRGAEIASSIPFLADVAPLISWERDSGDAGTDPPIGWTIVRTCSRYDRLRVDHCTLDALGALSADDNEDFNRVHAALEDLVMSEYAPHEVRS